MFDQKLGKKKHLEQVCVGVFKFLNACNKIREDAGQTPFEIPLEKKTIQNSDGSYRNAIAPTPALISFAKVLADQKHEQAIYDVFNPTIVAHPGADEVKIPFIRKQGSARVQTMAEYNSDPINAPKVSADIGSDPYPVKIISDAFSVTDEEVLSTQAMAGQYGIGGLDILSIRSRAAIDTVTREIDNQVYTTFTDQFSATGAYANETTSSNLWSVPATTAQQILNDLIAMADGLTVDAVFKPTHLIVHPVSRGFLEANLVGSSGAITVGERFATSVKNSYNPGVDLKIVVTTRAGNNAYLIDASPSNMIAGMTANVYYDKPEYRGSVLIQQVKAKTIGFNPLLKKAAIGYVVRS